MKKVIATLSSLMLLVGTCSSTLIASASTNNSDVVVGYVEDSDINTQSSKSLFNSKKYSLDFSCLNVKVKDNRIIAEPNMDKISKVSKAKNFNATKQNRLIESAIKTQNLLESTLSDNSIHAELIQIIKEHSSKTNQMPIISLTEDSILNASPNKDTLFSRGITPYLDGQEEGSSIRLYTSVSGTKSGIWGQSNAYIKNPTIVGANMYYPDGISLSWESPWKLSNNYALSLVDFATGNNIPPSLSGAVRTGGSTGCLAYSYNQKNVKGSYLGATLLNGSSGGHNLYSKYIRSNLSLPYSFSGSDGKLGISVSPSLGTSSVDSSVYFSV